MGKENGVEELIIDEFKPRIQSLQGEFILSDNFAQIEAEAQKYKGIIDLTKGKAPEKHTTWKVDKSDLPVMIKIKEKNYELDFFDESLGLKELLPSISSFYLKTEDICPPDNPEGWDYWIIIPVQCGEGRVFKCTAWFAPAPKVGADRVISGSGRESDSGELSADHGGGASLRQDNWLPADMGERLREKRIYDKW